MQRERKIGARMLLAIPSALAGLVAISCQAKVYPTLAAEGASNDAGTEGAVEPEIPGETASTPELGDDPPPPVGLPPRNSLGGPALELECTADAAPCLAIGDAGAPPSACISKGPRDCRSDADNDCDRQPDDAIDDVCVCVAGSVEDCDEHIGLDGRGQCRAGVRTCLFDEATLTTTWSACAGAVGPGDEDSCVPGDDSDCDGTPNEACECIVGRGNGPCSDDANNSRCNGQGQCVPCQSDPDCSLVSGDRNRCIGGECIVPAVPARLVGTANVDPPRLSLAGEQLFVYVDDSQSGAVLTVTFTVAADDSFTIMNEINAITSARVVASATAGRIALTTVEAGAGVFLSVYDSAAASILGLQGLGTAEGESF